MNGSIDSSPTIADDPFVRTRTCATQASEIGSQGFCRFGPVDRESRRARCFFTMAPVRTRCALGAVLRSAHKQGGAGRCSATVTV